MIIFRKISYRDNDKVPSYMSRKGGRLLSTLLVPLLVLFFSVHLTVSPTFTFQDKTIEMASTHFVSFLLVATFR